MEYKAAGCAAYRQGDYEGAAEEFTKALLPVNDIPESEKHLVYSNRSSCHASMGNYDKALMDADFCVNLKPSFVKGHARRGLALFYLERYEEAYKAYENGLAYDIHNEALRQGLKDCQRALSSKKKQANEMGNVIFSFGKVRSTFMRLWNPLGLPFLQWIAYTLCAFGVIIGFMGFFNINNVGAVLQRLSVEAPPALKQALDEISLLLGRVDSSDMIQGLLNLGKADGPTEL